MAYYLAIKGNELFKKCIDFRERREEGKTERSIYLLFHLDIPSLVAFCMCPDWESNTQPWCVGKMLSPGTEILS